MSAKTRVLIWRVIARGVRRLQTMRLALSLLLAGVLLAACGYKGPLYLPKPKPDAQRPAPAPAPDGARDAPPPQ
jgi:predicted small lipoprotein YifL